MRWTEQRKLVLRQVSIDSLLPTNYGHEVVAYH